jgi:hypothetical protein
MKQKIDKIGQLLCMDKETHEALKFIVDYLKVREPSIAETNEENIQVLTKLYRVENWLDEVVKDYE